MGLSINADDIHLFRKYCTFFLPRIVNLKEENRPKWVSFSFPDPLGELFDLNWNEYASSVEWSEIEYKRTDIDYDDIILRIAEDGGQYIFDFPAIKDVELSAH